MTVSDGCSKVTESDLGVCGLCCNGLVPLEVLGVVVPLLLMKARLWWLPVLAAMVLLFKVLPVEFESALLVLSGTLYPKVVLPEVGVLQPLSLAGLSEESCRECE